MQFSSPNAVHKFALSSYLFKLTGLDESGTTLSSTPNLRGSFLVCFSGVGDNVYSTVNSLALFWEKIKLISDGFSEQISKSSSSYDSWLRVDSWRFLLGLFSMKVLLNLKLIRS